MAPLKPATHNNILPGITVRNAVATRSKGNIPLLKDLRDLKDAKDSVRGKRKADSSPSKENKINKRIAFGDRNINVDHKSRANEDRSKKAAAAKKTTLQMKTLPSIKTALKPKHNENLAPPPAPGNKVVTRAAVKNVPIPNQTALKSKEVLKDTSITNKVNKRLSNEFEKTEDTLYSTALEEFAKKYHNLRSTKLSTDTKKSGEKSASVSLVVQEIEAKLNLNDCEVPEGVDNFDKENWDDVFQVSHYAMDIFQYMKEREAFYQVNDYMDRQICLTRWMRSLLVDWMVEIQESFELNHETLYLGVKLVDMYLSKMTVGKETLQLVGAAAMFISSKYDERIPPLIDDFLYICDGAYTRRELIRMEINLLKICDFNLGIPISYRFLRRYARCAKISMPILTLARYILEFSLMEYDTIIVRDSKLASAALYMALRMKQVSGWTPTLEFYTGYKLDDFKSVAILLNTSLSKPAKSQLMTVRNKYSHKIFFEVARTPLLQNDQL